MVNPVPILKSFGAAAKAVAGASVDSANRARTEFDITDGELVQNITVTAAGGGTGQHRLGRNPVGAAVLLTTPHTFVSVVSVTNTTITLEADSDTTVSVWVV